PEWQTLPVGVTALKVTIIGAAMTLVVFYRINEERIDINMLAMRFDGLPAFENTGKDRHGIKGSKGRRIERQRPSYWSHHAETRGGAAHQTRGI
ncbi:MAG TPA: hypothetical protein VFM10_00950, partial [Terriglobales bacterium]|nr:hypothetical protein [Terriglobales bacterium]